MYKIPPDFNHRYNEFPVAESDTSSEYRYLIPKTASSLLQSRGMAGTTEAIAIERKISHGIGGAGNVRMCLPAATSPLFMIFL